MRKIQLLSLKKLSEKRFRGKQRQICRKNSSIYWTTIISIQKSKEESTMTGFMASVANKIS
jgi:hypothetical protein